MKKRFMIFCAAMITAAFTFVANAACNEYGWTSKDDMYKALAEDVWEYDQTDSTSTFVFTNFDTENIAFNPSSNTAGTGIAYDVEPWDMNFFSKEPYASKWGWLINYLDTTNAAGGFSKPSEGGQAVTRYTLTAFFGNDARTSWPKSADYTNCGIDAYLVWQPYWGTSYCVKEVCNDYGWKNKDDMYKALAEDVWEYDQTDSTSTFVFTNFDTENIAFNPSSNTAGTGIAYDVEPWDMNFFSKEPYASKWGWLIEYLDTTNAAGGFSKPSEGGQAVTRYTLTAFFGNDARTSWPKSADYANCGIDAYLVWQPYWGQSYCTGSATVNVNYELLGSVTNDYGWTKPEDMYQALAADVLEAYGEGAGVCPSFVFASEFPSRGTFGTPDVNGNEGVAFDIQSFDLTFCTTDPYASKWGWLWTYLDTTAVDASTTKPSTNSSFMRYALAAFFGDSQRGSWPKSADYTYSGVSNITMWQSYWEHAWDNPTEFPTDSTVVLNNPYKEGETFKGWYLNEQGAGDPVTEVTSFHNNLTLYAIFGLYVSNTKEVWAAYDTLGTATMEIKTGGVVTYISSNGTFYFQDDFGGMQGYQKGADTIIALGDKITVQGTLVDYNGVPEIKNITKFEVQAQGQEVNVPTVTLPNVGLTFAGKCYTKLYFESLKLYDAKDKNLYFCDGKDSVIYYDNTLLAKDYTVGKKYSVTGVLTAYYGKRELVNNEIQITPIASVAADPATYDAKQVQNEYSTTEDLVTYSITSNWLISRNMGNWDSYKPNPNAEESRGMCVANGKVYVNWRSSNTPDAGTMKLNVYDAASGDKLDDVFFKNYVFQQPAADTTGTRTELDEETGFTKLAEGYEWNYDEFTEGVIFAPNTDMQVDAGGNILVSSLPTEGHTMQIWKIDPETGAGEIVLYLGGNSGVSDLAERFPLSGTIRLDRFAVDGDVTKDATIIYSAEGSSNVYEFDIYDGEWDSEVTEIKCLNGANPAEEPVAFSYTSRPAFVEGGDAFYIDGFSTYPELFDFDGAMLESFSGIYDEEGTELQPSCTELLYNDSLIASPKGVCGCQEFKVGGATFFVMAGGSYEGGYEPCGSTKIYRYQDANCHFYEMTPMWEVSKDGFGSTKNAQFNYQQQAVVVDETTTELYVYVAENGLGKYTIKASKDITPETSLEDVLNNANDDVKKVIVNGQIYIIRNGVAYTAMGQVAE